MSTTLTIYKGDKKVINVTFTSNGSAYDITGKTLLFAVKPSVSDADSENVIEKTVTSHTNPTGGATQIVLSTSDTNVTPGTYSYGIKLVTGTDPTTYVVGICKVKYPVPLGASL